MTQLNDQQQFLDNIVKSKENRKDSEVPEIALADINLQEIFTHVGICDLTSSLIQDILRYDPVTESFYHYNKSWNEQEPDILYSFLTDIGRQLMGLSWDYPDKETKKMVRETGAKMLNNSTRESIMKMIVQENYLNANFDQKLHLVGCNNGIFNTKSYKLRRNSSTLFVSKKINANYDPNTSCPVFTKFISQLFEEEDVREYVQRIFGSCLAGKPNKVLPIFYGDADNGKTCLLEVMQSVFGDYATVVMPDVLFTGSGTSTSNRQTQIVGMKGFRLCTISETSESHVVNSSSLKKLTGGDTIVDRSLYARKVVSFEPTHTIFMGTNALPYMKSDPALETRIRHIYMKNSFVLHPDLSNPNQFPVDTKIKEKILKERDGIFQWLIEGCRNFDKHGLFVPKSIKEANKKIKEDNDLIQQFINEGIIKPIDSPDEIRYLVKPFHEAFQIWYKEFTQQNPWGKATILKQMKDKGFKTKSSNGLYFYYKKGTSGVF